MPHHLIAMRSGPVEKKMPPNRRPAALWDVRGDDASLLTRLGRVNADGLVGFEVKVAFDWETELAADGASSARLT